MTNDPKPTFPKDLLWTGCALIGIPIAGLVLFFLWLYLGTAVDSRRNRAYQKIAEPMSRNDSQALIQLRSVGTCLEEYRTVRGGNSYPLSLSALGPSGTGCLADDAAQARLQGHSLEYVPAVPLEDGRIPAYSLCARPEVAGKTGWVTTVILVPSENPNRNSAGSRPSAPGMTEPIGCVAALDDPADALRYCAMSYARSHESQGYPSDLTSIGPGGNGCLSYKEIHQDVVAVGAYDKREYAYLPGLADMNGRIATFTIVRKPGYAWITERGVHHVTPPPRPDSWIETRARERREKDGNLRIDRLDSECGEGIGESCAKLGDAFVPEHARAGDALKAWSKAVEAYERGCRLKHAPSCYRAGEAWLDGPVYTETWYAGKLEFEGYTGKRLRDSRACPYLEKACALGYAAGCGDLLRGREMHVCPKGDALSTRKALEKACGAGDEPGCVDLGKLLLDGSGCESTDAKRAADYFEIACRPDQALGCAPFAKVYGSGCGRPKDLLKSRYYSRMACALADDAAACAALGTP